METATSTGAEGSSAPGPEGEVRVLNRQGGLRSSIEAGSHTFFGDEPVRLGGTGSGPNPYDFLLAALGTCTAMTLRLYAEHKKIPLESVEVRLSHTKVHATDCAECETKEGKVDVIHRTLLLEGPLTEGQRERLLEMADRCPVHRTLTGEISIRTRLG